MDNSPIKLLLFGNQTQHFKAADLIKILQTLKENHTEIYIEKDFYDFLSSECKHQLNHLIHKVVQEYHDLDVQLILSIGGDGTFLQTVKKAHTAATNIPILGINTGQLGFLSELKVGEIGEALDYFKSGNYEVEERCLIEASVVNPQGDCILKDFALNEVALLKSDNSALINIEAHIHHKYLTNYIADGLIICTPTGSTGYSLSVNGPIMAPNSKTFCLSPVAPHSLTVRPVIIADNATLQFKVSSRTNKYLIAVDGRSTVIEDDELVCIQKAPFKIQLLKLKKHNFFDTLRDKFSWGGRA